MKSIIGKKVGMTQVFNDNGDCLPVTLVHVDRCVPVFAKTPEKDGYKSVLVAYGNRKESRTNKPLKGSIYCNYKFAQAANYNKDKSTLKLRNSEGTQKLSLYK